MAGSVTRQQFAIGVMQDLLGGSSASSAADYGNSIDALLGLFQQQGSVFENNPVGSTLEGYPTTSGPPTTANVQNYSTPAVGEAATASLLSEQLYAGVKADLLSNASVGQTSSAINELPSNVGWSDSPGLISAGIANSSTVVPNNSGKSSGFKFPSSLGISTGVGSLGSGSSSPTTNSESTTPSTTTDSNASSSSGLMAKIGGFGLGAILLLVGIIILFHSSGAQQETEQAGAIAAAS